MNADIERELQACVQSLRSGGFALIPADTGWSVICDLKNIGIITTMITCKELHLPAVMLKESGQLQKYMNEISDAVYDMIEFSTRPLQLISDKVLNNPLNNLDSDEDCAFRVVKDEFTLNLIHKFGSPLFGMNLISNTRQVMCQGILNNSLYMVNLRPNAKATTEDLVIIKVFEGGQFRFIKK